jgi:hypothetical protein
MSAQDYAREQASRLAETDPSAAFDLVLAADDLDKSAAQRPEISALGRRMRGIMAEAVKHMARAVPDLVWECGGAYDYIGLGKKFTLQGMTAPKEWNSGVRIRVEIVANAAHQGPGYNVRVYSEGKGGRSIGTGEYVKEVLLDDLKKQVPKALATEVPSIKKHLAGSLDEEKARVLEYIDDAIKTMKEAIPPLQAARKKANKSKNLIGDIDEIRGLLRPVSYKVDLRSLKDYLEELQRAGG